jgi:ABC-type sugar transport system permease subunit
MESYEYIALASILLGAVIFASPLSKKSKFKALACLIYEVGVVINLIVAIQVGVWLFIITNIIFLFVNLWGIINGLRGK